MELKRTYSGRATSIPKGLSIGAAASLAVTLVGASVIAKLVDIQTIKQEQIGYAILMLLIISSFMGAKVSYTAIKHKKMVICTLSGLLYIGILLSITALFFGGQYEAVAVTSAVVLAGSCSAGLLDKQGIVRGKGRKKKFAHR